jgi:hypothetical protein
MYRLRMPLGDLRRGRRRPPRAATARLGSAAPIGRVLARIRGPSDSGVAPRPRVGEAARSTAEWAPREAVNGAVPAWCAQKKDPGLAVLKRLARALGVPVTELLE